MGKFKELDDYANIYVPEEQEKHIFLIEKFIDYEGNHHAMLHENRYPFLFDFDNRELNFDLGEGHVRIDIKSIDHHAPHKYYKMRSYYKTVQNQPDSWLTASKLKEEFMRYKDDLEKRKRKMSLVDAHGNPIFNKKSLEDNANGSNTRS